MLFKEEILKYFTNWEIFILFKSNKRILLFLIEEKIISLTSQIIDTLTDYEHRNLNYFSYFQPEINFFIESQLTQEDEKVMINKFSDSFEQKRLKGENDNYLESLIQNDLIDEFISYVNQNNVFLSGNIKTSIFDTNSFLINKAPSLIEYSAFFGSIQIFKYLYKNKAKITPSIWIYAIHGQNPELFKILEENHIEPKVRSFSECLNESIKCHHIEITNYIQNNLLSQSEKENEHSIELIFEYKNYAFFPNKDEIKKYFYYLCKYDYFSLVEILIKDQSIDVNSINQNTNSIQIECIYIISNSIILI